MIHEDLSRDDLLDEVKGNEHRRPPYALQAAYRALRPTAPRAVLVTADGAHRTSTAWAILALFDGTIAVITGTEDSSGFTPKVTDLSAQLLPISAVSSIDAEVKVDDRLIVEPPTIWTTVSATIAGRPFPLREHGGEGQEQAVRSFQNALAVELGRLARQQSVLGAGVRAAPGPAQSPSD